MTSVQPGRVRWAAVAWTISFFCAATGNVTVTQSPQTLTKRMGETADLLCTYEGPAAPGSYKWLRGSKQGSKVSNSAPEYRGRVAETSPEMFLRGKNASIRIMDLKWEDTGFYLCRVELMGIGAAFGAGTTVIVEAPGTDGRVSLGGLNVPTNEGNSDQTSLPLTYLLLIVLPVLLTITAVSVARLCCTRAAPQQPVSSDALYAEIGERGSNYVNTEYEGTRGVVDSDGVQYAKQNLLTDSQTYIVMNTTEGEYVLMKLRDEGGDFPSEAASPMSTRPPPTLPRLYRQR